MHSFRSEDGIDVGLNEGVSAVIQPGGSLRDFESIEACNEKNAAMVFHRAEEFQTLNAEKEKTCRYYCCPLQYFLPLIVFLVLNFVRVSRLQDDIKEYTDLMLSESSVTRENDDYLNSLSTVIAHDLNKTRASLGLPVKNYRIQDLSGEASPPDKGDVLIFSGIDALMKAESDNKKSVNIGEFLQKQIILQCISENSIAVNKLSNTSYIMAYEKREFLTVNSPDEHTISLLSFNGDKLEVNAASKETVFFIEKKP